MFAAVMFGSPQEPIVSENNDIVSDIETTTAASEQTTTETAAPVTENATSWVTDLSIADNFGHVGTYTGGYKNNAPSGNGKYKTVQGLSDGSKADLIYEGQWEYGEMINGKMKYIYMRTMKP